MQMKFYRWMIMSLIVVLVSLSFSVGGKAVSPSRGELDQAREWIGANFSTMGPAAKLPPFSFVYGNKPSSALLKGWRVRVGPSTRRDAASQQSYLYTDPATGLELRCEVTRYADFPAVEWVLYIKNTGREPTPILQQVRALDTRFGSSAGRFVLHWALGSNAKPTDFEPRDQALGAGTRLSFSPVGGRSSNTTALPFFNLEAPQIKGQEGGLKGGRPDTDSLDEGGVVMGVGWSGQWSASFSQEADGVHTQAGMELTHLSLKPGESIRTPRMLLLFWKGSDRLRGQNLLRRFILVHDSPRPGGHCPTLPVAACSWVAFDSGNKVTEKNQIEFASTYKRMMPIDTFWLDAGWFEGGWPNGVGNWFAKKDGFPQGLRPLGEAVHKMGMRFIVWFEPERVHQGTWLDTHHPEWVLGQGKTKPTVWSGADTKLLNLGNNAARQWLTNHIAEMIKEDVIDIYRNDFNMDPLPYWRNSDAPDRQGMTEIRYVQGLYDFWDDLLRQYPNLMIDNCASGGRRIDLETISRSVALWRTDYVLAKKGSPGVQAQGVGLGLWVPLNATAAGDLPDVYAARSAMGAGLVSLWDVRRSDFDAALAERLIQEEIRIQKYYYGDLYPLTAVSSSDQVWFAYQYDRPDLGEGMVMAFRREKAPEKSWTVKLRGLDAKRRYELEDLDTGKKNVYTGKKLATGLRLDIADTPGSRLLIYRVMR
jgi:alpha-galactosidase